MLIRFLRQKVTDFKNNTQGIVVPIFGAVAFTVVTVVAVAIDVNQFNDIEKELQALADKSVQSAMSRSMLNLNGIGMGAHCTNFFNDGLKNNPKFKNTVTLDLSDFEEEDQYEENAVICSIDKSTSDAIIWKLTARVKIKTHFSGMLGTEYKTKIISAASHNDIKHEVVVVASTAGTMCGKITKDGNDFSVIKAKQESKLKVDDKGKISNATDTDSECQKIDFMKAGIESLYRQIQYLQDLRMGFVPFNHTVKFPGFDSNTGFSDSSLPPSLKASKLIEGRDSLGMSEEMDIYTELSREASDSDYLPEIVPLLPVDIGALFKTGTFGFYDHIKKALDAIKTTPNTPAWARMDLGMHVAGLMLDKDSAAYFNDHDVASFDDSKRETQGLSQYGGTGTGVKKNKVKKNIVLISDGMNAGAVYTNQPAGNFGNNYFYQYEPYNKHLLDVCNVLKNPEKNNVQIFTIIVQGDEGEKISDDAENIMARCSSDIGYTEDVKYDFTTDKKTCNDNKYCYKAGTADELNFVLQKIGKKINTVVMQQ